MSKKIVKAIKSQAGVTAAIGAILDGKSDDKVVAAVKSAEGFVVAALGHGFVVGKQDQMWSHDRNDAIKFETRSAALEALAKWRAMIADFPEHADASPGENSAAATLDPGAKAALAQHFPRLHEVDVDGSPYKLLQPIEGVKASDLTVAERRAMAERQNIVGPKLPKYAPKTNSKVVPKVAAESPAASKSKGTKMATKAKKKSAVPKDMREKMEKVGAGAAKIMKKAEAQRKKEGKKTTKAPGEKKQGIGAFCEALLAKKKTPEDILVAVKKAFPKAKTSMASIAWYRNKMREEGTLPK